MTLVLHHYGLIDHVLEVPKVMDSKSKLHLLSQTIHETALTTSVGGDVVRSVTSQEVKLVQILCDTLSSLLESKELLLLDQHHVLGDVGLFQVLTSPSGRMA